MIKIKQIEDQNLLEDILKQLKENNGHCPCQFGTQSQDTVCICSAFKDEINTITSGEIECPCGRYIAIITED